MRASQPKRILVVDDEPHVAMVLAEALSKLPEACELLIAENATQALAKAKTQPIDFLITDFQMPDADGLTLITALRKLSPNMATILMTAHGTEQVERRAEKLGVDQFMPKPFNLADFRRVAWQALEKTRPAAPPAPQPVPHALASQLQQLLKDTGAHCACLIHNGGGLIESVGSLSDRDTQMLATLMAANFAAMTELARLLGNPRSFEAVNHESKDDNIYTCVAGAEHLLVVVFGWAARPGLVPHEKDGRWLARAARKKQADRGRGPAAATGRVGRSAGRNPFWRGHDSPARDRASAGLPATRRLEGLVIRPAI
jgi:CheY-like chemotaxis protein